MKVTRDVAWVGVHEASGGGGATISNPDDSGVGLEGVGSGLGIEAIGVVAGDAPASAWRAGNAPWHPVRPINIAKSRRVIALPHWHASHGVPVCKFMGATHAGQLYRAGE